MSEVTQTTKPVIRKKFVSSFSQRHETIPPISLLFCRVLILGFYSEELF